MRCGTNARHSSCCGSEKRRRSAFAAYFEGEMLSALLRGTVAPGRTAYIHMRELCRATQVVDDPPPLDRMTYRASLLGLLEGHWGILLIGLAAVGAESGSALLEPWPIKIVLDTVLRAKPLPEWLERAIASMLGTN